MSDEELSELDELVGEWANAASEDDVDPDLLDLDSLADDWAHKDDDAGEIDDARELDVEDDWAGREAAALPDPPDPEEPITLPKRPDPVLLPPLPEGDLSDAAQQGDHRYASPIETPLPEPKPETIREDTPESEAEETDRSAALLGLGVIAGGVAASKTAYTEPASSAEIETPDAPIEPQPEPTAPVAPAIARSPEPTPQTTTHETPAPVAIHADQEEDPIWRRWLPFAVIAGAGVIWLAFMAMTGQTRVDNAAPPRVIEKASRVDTVVSVEPETTEPAPIQPSLDLQLPDTPIEPTAIDPATPAPVETAPIEVETEPTAPEPVTVEAPEVEVPLPSETAAPEVPEATESVAVESADITAPSVEVETALPEPTEPVFGVETESSDPRPSPLPTIPEPEPEPAAASVNAGPAPQKIIAAPASSPRIKPSSINRSIELSRPRTTTTRTVITNTGPTTQRIVRTAPTRTTTYQTITTQSSIQPVTAIELLHDKAAQGARTLSTPSATASFNAAINRALLQSADGDANAVRTPDGRLLALKILSTREEQLRSVMIPRAQEVRPPPTNLVLAESWSRTTDRVGLRAQPFEGPAIKSLERGTLLEVIGRVKDTDWQLVGINGRATGYLLGSELTSSVERASTNLANSDAQAIAFGAARIRTRCRTAQYAIDEGGASGGFTACRVYGGDWVLERNGDLPALSPGRLVFKR